jgi:hypothetical protein
MIGVDTDFLLSLFILATNIIRYGEVYCAGSIGANVVVLCDLRLESHVKKRLHSAMLSCSKQKIQCLILAVLRIPTIIHRGPYAHKDIYPYTHTRVHTRNSRLLAL